MSADPQARESIAIRILWMLLFVWSGRSPNCSSGRWW